MKIVRKPNIVYQNKQARIAANIGCHFCPFCGAFDTDINHFTESWEKGLFKVRHMQVDNYYCTKCGAAWKSKVYRVLEQKIRKNPNRKFEKI